MGRLCIWSLDVFPANRDWRSGVGAACSTSPGDGRRRDSGIVLSVTESEVEVGWGKEGMASVVEALPVAVACCLVDMVRAGAISRAGECSGMQGQRVSVYWPMDADRMTNALMGW